MWEYDELAGRFLAETEDAYGSDPYLADPYAGGYSGKKEEEPLDYSVLSVGVLTLGLILLVEIVRHHIDHSAHGRPFFQAVLANVYSELATLGIVEFSVFILLKYYENINKERKNVFADVHFCLFYVAILNAFQSVFAAAITTRVSNKLWVNTEHLELDHYVEIREAFDHVKEQVESDNCLHKWNPFTSLRARYLTLLVQVRFHELRLQFLESNDLPLTLKVSDYLKRAEQRLLIQLVQISELAWLLLTGGLNLVYFLEGIIAYKTGDDEIVSQTLTSIFFIMLIVFILITIALYYKMKSIFQEILSMEIVKGESHEEGLKRQRSFFWLGQPKLVISVIQFMQFGYALQLAIVLMYWEIFTALHPLWYLGATLVCYSIFAYVLSLVLPQYTLCTSLGYMVNQTHLQETVALHRLEDEQRRQRRRKAEAHYSYDDSMLALEDTPAKRDSAEDSKILIPSSDGSPTLGSSDRSTDSGDSAIGRNETRQDSQRDLKAKTALMAALIKSDTASLRQQLPEVQREKLANRAAENIRRPRMKTLSDGVASMRNMGNLPALRQQQSSAAAASLTTDDAEVLKRDRDKRMALRRANRRKTASASAVIQSWRNVTDAENSNANSKKGMQTTDGDSFVKLKGDESSERRKQRRRGEERRKSSSTSDINQAFFGATKTVEGESGQPEAADAYAARIAERRLSRKKAVSASDINEAFFEETKTAEDETVEPVAKEGAADDARAARIAQRRRSRKKAVSASSVIQSWQDYSVNDSHQEGNTLPRRSMDDIMAFSRSTPVLTAAVLEDPGAEKLVVENPQPIEAAPVPAEPSQLDAMDARSHGSGSVIVDMSGTMLASGDAQDMPLKESDGNVMVPEKTDDDTVDTGKSVGELSDGLSDVDIDDDLIDSIRPPASHDEHDWKHELGQHFTPAGLVKDLKGFFVSETYQTVSHVFGTLVVFFLIGQRVEAMNAATGAFDQSDNTWELALNSSYWWEVVWYCLFICTDLLVMILFLPGRVSSVVSSSPERKVLIATGFDLMLSGGCLALLLVSEMLRCCDADVDEQRYLADETGFGSDFEETQDYGTDSEDCCGAWGSRTYGGLGNIEPFTSLIALRVLRFFLAGFLVKQIVPKEQKKAEEGSTEGTEGGSGDHSHADHTGGHGDGHGHGHGHGHGDVGSVLELWESAIAKHPDIVKQYGQFSSELLKSMLGLEVVHEPKRSNLLQANHPNGAKLLTQASFQGEAESEPKQSTIKLQTKQYTNLPPECQAIIIAGRLGMPVKSKSGSMDHDSVPVSELPTLTEDSEVYHDHESHDCEFEIDQEQLAEEEESDSMFIAPSARLVRSMRRCHRRLLPILKEWVPVDVAVTQFEIVYFEVSEDENENTDGAASLHHLQEVGRQALKATKGGKGLRLRDVAAGRKVVGHFDLADVTEVHVERDLPLPEGEEEADEEEEIEPEAHLCSEFWSDDRKAHNGKCSSRNQRWAKTKEDRLKVKSVHGTLVLRFFSDLDEMEAHKDDGSHEVEGGASLKKLVAYQWAQTIVHSCGRDQLKQMLPHYGEAAGEELQDYVEVGHYHDEEAHKAHKKALRRKSSHLNLVDMVSHPTHRRSGSSSKLRRATSFEGNEKKPINKKSFRRTISSGDYDNQRSSSGFGKFDVTSAEGRQAAVDSPKGQPKADQDQHDIV